MFFAMDKCIWISRQTRVFSSWSLEFRENIPTCNKICSSSEFTGFTLSEAAFLSLDKASPYRFFQRVSGRNASTSRRWHVSSKHSLAESRPSEAPIKIFLMITLQLYTHCRRILSKERQWNLCEKLQCYAQNMILKCKRTGFLLSKTLWLICYHAVNIPRLLINILLCR